MTQVLLIEDDAMYAGLISGSLGSAFSVRWVEDLETAIALLHDATFDVVLADLGLPDVEGICVLEQLRAAATTVPILALTGLDDERIAIEALRFGIQDYLIKTADDGQRVARAIRYAIARKKAEEHLHHLAMHDQLTGVGNRTLFRARLEQGILHAKRLSTQLGLLYLDLDRFKPVNDTYGHAAGDSILKQLAGRLEAGTRATDTVARMGGDEFTVILGGFTEAAGAYAVADKLLASLTEPYQLAETALTVTPSIGLALYPADGETVGALASNADAALYAAKALGGNRWRTFADTA